MWVVCNLIDYCHLWWLWSSLNFPNDISNKSKNMQFSISSSQNIFFIFIRHQIHFFCIWYFSNHFHICSWDSFLLLWQYNKFRLKFNRYMLLIFIVRLTWIIYFFLSDFNLLLAIFSINFVYFSVWQTSSFGMLLNRINF